MTRHRVVISSAWLRAHVRAHGGRLWVVEGVSIVG